jgi:hypothetical protein
MTLNIRSVRASLALTILLISFTPQSFSQSLFDNFIDPLDSNIDASSYLTENSFGFLPVPIIITEPAVDSGFGMIGLFFHEDDEQADQRKKGMQGDNPEHYLIPPSVSAVAAAYTGNESYFAGAGHLGFFNSGKIRYSGGVGYGDVKLDYFQLGNIELNRPLSITTEMAALFQELKFRTGKLPLFIGPIQRYLKADLSISSLQDNQLVDNINNSTGIDLADFFSQKITTSGLGIGMEFDTRDNIFTPTDGAFYELSYVKYDEKIGSDIDYDWYRFKGHQYIPLSDNWRGAVRLVAEVADSNTSLPPFATPGINLRGIPAARYQGSHVATLEGEVTWQMSYRWSLLGFAGAGKAATSGGEFSAANSQLSQGVGFRYLIAKKFGFNMGIDIARGPEDTVWYVQAGSAW